jgi:glucose/mannose-6-phosphate isomerase
MKFIDQLKDLKEQVKFKAIFEINRDYENIIIAGMGGSGIVGNIFKELYLEKPIITVNDYFIPKFVNEKTLFIGISYSGNTEETLSATEQARKNRANVFTISSGGKLKELGSQNINVPSGLQPRSSLGYMLLPLINTFMPQDSIIIERTYKLVDNLDNENEFIKRQANEIGIKNKIPVIYGYSPFKTVAYRWKTQFNENSKILAYSNSFPELNHNDTMPLRDTYQKDKFIFFSFGAPVNEKIKARISITSKITSTNFINIVPLGNSVFEKLFYLIHYGDYLSYYLALYRGMVPEDVSIIEQLKQELKKQ